ncbi:hypothetical protein DL96DRAFT_1701903 [Flagelloscypha sp. PMI_526]|nr:hypothetical protein DL96DRAFT_1701903 [Flagelloscypha sp. PMI_526]
MVTQGQDMQTSHPRRIVKVAVIGSGLAGLTAAYILAQPRESEEDILIETHLFEKAWIQSLLQSRKRLRRSIERRIDVPMRSFQGGSYPNLIQLYRKLGVTFRVSNFSITFGTMSQAANTFGRTITASFIYNGASGRKGLGMPASLRREKTPEFTPTTPPFTSLHASFRYIFLSIPLWKTPEIQTLTFEQWVVKTRWDNFLTRLLRLDVAWDAFCFDILCPLYAAVCTAPQEAMLVHPVEDFLGFGTPHYKVNNGVQDVVARLSKGLDHIHLSCRITSIEPDATTASKASICCETSAGERQTFPGFDHVVFATQASRAVPLLEKYASNTRSKAPILSNSLESLADCLANFKYTGGILNFIVADKHFPASTDLREITSVPGFIMATHVLSTATNPPILQTTNPIIAPKQESILSVSKLERAVLTMPAKRALQGLYTPGRRKIWQTAMEVPSHLGPLQGAGRLSTDGENGPGVWICGAYACAGIPLLEGCVSRLKEQPW